jgi:hypothetical protein
MLSGEVRAGCGPPAPAASELPPPKPLHPAAVAPSDKKMGKCPDLWNILGLLERHRFSSYLGTERRGGESNTHLLDHSAVAARGGSCRAVPCGAASPAGPWPETRRSPRERRNGVEGRVGGWWGPSGKTVTRPSQEGQKCLIKVWDPRRPQGTGGIHVFFEPCVPFPPPRAESGPSGV